MGKKWCSVGSFPLRRGYKRHQNRKNGETYEQVERMAGRIINKPASIMSMRIGQHVSELDVGEDGMVIVDKVRLMGTVDDIKGHASYHAPELYISNMIDKVVS